MGNPKMTKVVNVKVAHIRPKYENLKMWCRDVAKNAYIGRRGVVFVDGIRTPARDSVFANPFKIKGIETRDTVITNYRSHILGKFKSDPDLVRALMDLEGKVINYTLLFNPK